MYKNDFQGGPYYEIFSAQGKDPIANKWSLAPSIRRDFDKSLKSYVYILEGNSTKMQLPKDSKTPICLVQRYLVLQVFVAKGQDFTIDIGLRDGRDERRRLRLATALTQTQVDPLHVKIPLALIHKGMWLNLCLDLYSMVTETWRCQFKSIERITVTASCKLRRIFTMKQQPADTSGDDETLGVNTDANVEADSIPRQCQLAMDVSQAVQVINMAKVRAYEGHSRPERESTTLDLNSSGGKKNLMQDSHYHIAFGSKVAGVNKKGSAKEGTPTSRIVRNGHSRSKSETAEGSTTRGPPSAGSSHMPSSAGSSSSKASHHLTTPKPRDRKNSDPGADVDDPDVKVDKESLRTSKTWTDGADDKASIPFVKPHPPSQPRETSGDRIRRPHRVRSAGKERTLSYRDDGSQVSLNSGAPSSGNSSQNGSQTNISQLGEKPLSGVERPGHRLSAGKDASRKDRNILEQDQGDGDEGEELLEVINVLRGAGLQDNNDAIHADYESSEEEPSDAVYTFSSKPKSAPRQHSSASKRKSSYLKQKVKDRHKGKEAASNSPTKENRMPKNKGSSISAVARQQPDSHHSNSTNLPADKTVSSDDDEGFSVRVDTRIVDPSQRSQYSESSSDTSPIHRQSGVAMHSEWTMKSHMVANTNSNVVARVDNNQQKPKENGLPSVPVPQKSEHPGSGASQPKTSISKKALREIPKDDVRLSQQGSKPYDSRKYQMKEFTDSQEEAMLLNLQQDEAASDEEDAENYEKYEYDNVNKASLSESEDNTSMSTLKRQEAAQLCPYKFAEEMNAYSGHFPDNMLTQSNPRDTIWGGTAFSPPIVLPGDIKAGQWKRVQAGLYAGNEQGGGDAAGGGESNSEDELDLLYDQQLNCYYDPRTHRYYELKPHVL